MDASDTSLNIVVTAVNDAAEALAGVQDSLDSLTEQASAAGSAITDSLTTSFNATEEAAIAAAEATLNQWTDATAGIQEAGATLTGEWEGDLALMNSDTAAYLDSMDSRWQASIADLNTQLAEVPAEAATAGNEAGAALATGLESSISSLGGKLMAAGAIGGVISAAITAPIIGAIQSAASEQATMAMGTQELTNEIQANSNGTQQNAAQIESLTAKIQTYRAEIQVAQAGLLVWNGTTLEAEAAHAKESAAIATATSAMAPYISQLQVLQDKQSLGSQSATEISAQFQALADQNSNLGISFDDSYNALVGFTNQLGSVQNATLAYDDAVGLVVSGNFADLPSAAQAVTQAFAGMGRGLQTIIPDLKDGAAGTDALNQIWAEVQGTAPLAAQQLSTQTAALSTNSQLLGAAMTGDLTPGLTTAAKSANSMLDAFTAFADKHSAIVAAISAVALAVGGLATALGGLAFGSGLLLMVGEAFDTIADKGLPAVLTAIAAPLTSMFEGLGGFFTAVLAGNPETLIFVAALLAVAGAITLIITHLPEIEAFLKNFAASTEFVNAFKSAWDQVATTFETQLKPQFEQLWIALQPLLPYLEQLAGILGTILVGAIFAFAIGLAGVAIILEAVIGFLTWIATQGVNLWMGAWAKVQGALTDFISAMTNLPNTVEGVVTDVIKFFQPLITTLQNIESLVSKVMTSLGSSAGGLVGDIKGAVGSAAGVIGLATGGIVTSPTLAVVGEAGPEAVIPLSAFNGGDTLGGGIGSSGGGNIVVNITGTFLSQDAARQLGNMLAQSVNRQIKMSRI